MYGSKTLSNWFSWINERVAQKTLKIVTNIKQETFKIIVKEHDARNFEILDTINLVSIRQSVNALLVNVGHYTHAI